LDTDFLGVGLDRFIDFTEPLGGIISKADGNQTGSEREGTDTFAPWLNQVEVWFSKLTSKVLRGISFRSVEELVSQIDAFIAAYNQEAAPGEWSQIKVNAKTFTGKYVNLYK